MALKHSSLDAAHRALGAKMVPFGGWEMPLSYPAGTIAEHTECRTGAVAFDVSHLGTVRVHGPDALDRLQRSLTNDLTKIGPGRAQYTHLLDDADASVLDDIIVWWVDNATFDVMPNASNTERVLRALGAGEDITSSRAIVAVQGPQARSRLEKVSPDAAGVGRFRVSAVDWDGTGCIVAGTGYTGEDGVEVAVPAARAPDLWQALLDAGIGPAGLGARDTLRLEAGLPLHGHELGPGITPLQAGLGWVVNWDKGDFRGRDALAAERERGVARRLRGIEVAGRRPPRAGQSVLLAGAPVGEVTSGNFSPTLGHGIALAFLPPDVEAGTAVEVEARGDRLSSRVTALPFVKRPPAPPRPDATGVHP
ncbi:MAG: glycine cleavage system aminomethyltransferase GcvT [Acidimicrobiales bacterium]